MITMDLIDHIIWEVLRVTVTGILQSFVLLIIVLLSMSLLKNRLNAALRYLIWYVFLISIVCLPFFFANLAKYNQLPQAQDRITKSKVSNITEISLNAKNQEETKANSEFPSPTLPDYDNSINKVLGFEQNPYVITLALPKMLQGRWIYALFCGWILISFWKTLHIFLSYLSLQNIKRKCTFLTDEHQYWLKQHAIKMNARRSVGIAVSNDIAAPVVAGFRNVMILIPERLFRQLSGAEFEQVLLHELAHIRRYDDWTKLGQKFIEAIFFFHPVVYWMRSRLDIEREVACDNWVVSITGNRRNYAMCLTALVESFNDINALSFTPKMFSTTPQIYQRVNLVLDKKRNSTPGISPFGAAAVIAAMTGIFFCCALTFPTVKVAALAKDISDARMQPDLQTSERTAITEQDSVPSSIQSSERKTSARLIQNTNTSDLPARDDSNNTEIKEEKKIDERKTRQRGYTSPIDNLTSAEQKDGRQIRQGNASTPSAVDLRYAEQLDELMRPKRQRLEQKVFSEMQPEIREIEAEAYRLSHLPHEKEGKQSQETTLANERLKQRMKGFQNKADAKMLPQVREIEAEARLILAQKNGGIQK